MSVIECVPNISEGRRTEVITSIAEALRAVRGLRVLDVQSDATHNRSVFTLAGDADSLAAGIPSCSSGPSRRSICAPIAGSIRASGLSMSFPFVPIAGVTLAECVALAKQVGAAVADAL